MGNNINDPTVTNESLSQGYGGTPGTYGTFVGLANSETTFVDAVTTSNSIYKSDGSGDTLDSSLGTLEDIGTSNSPANRFPRYNNSSTHNPLDSPNYVERYTSSSTPTKSGTYNNVYAYGNLYTWVAAMANTNNMTSPSSSESVGTSICPTGWTLPTSSYDSTSIEVALLLQRYGGTGDDQASGSSGGGGIISRRLRTFPNNFVFSYFGSARGTRGTYWSRSASSGNSSYANSFSISYFGYDFPISTSTNSKFYSNSIRCFVINSN